MSQCFKKLGLVDDLTDLLSELGYRSPTEIQNQAIPHVLNGNDVLAGAQTGTGKTAAYGLPMIQMLHSQPKVSDMSSAARGLVLVPTRELAKQVFDNLTQYAQFSSLKIVAVYGGTSISQQTRLLKQGVDIVVATPGRLLDHVFCKHVRLDHLETLVLDEADRMLDMGFKPDIQRILKRTPDKRQTLLFSATFSPAVKTLAHSITIEPKEIQVTPENTVVQTIEEVVYPVDRHRKRELISYLIGSGNWQQVLIFVKTKQGADLLAKELKLDGIKSSSIHGDKSQGARQKALDDFKDRSVRALVATDVAARGIDINQLEYVVNFDMPYQAEDYIHRIGRSGRAGHAGHAVSLMSKHEEYILAQIEKLLNRRLSQVWLPGYEPGEERVDEEAPSSRRKSRSTEKKMMKKQLNIHAGRGKKKPAR